MPIADSKRRQALDGMVTTLAGITAGATYEYTLSGTGQVSKVIDTADSRLKSGHAITIRVRDGEETFRNIHLMRGTEGNLQVLVDIMMSRVTAEDMVDQFNDLLRDIHGAIDAARDLGTSGAIAEANIEAITAPQYDLDNQVAFAVVIVRVKYDYIAGQSGGL